MLAAQLILLLVAGGRGLDYVQHQQAVSPALALVEQAAGLPTWGCFFLAGALLLLIGLAAGRVTLILTGHAAIVTTYLWLGILQLLEVDVDDWLIVGAGALALTGSTWLVVTRWPRYDHVRVAVSVPLVMAAGWLTAFGLGSGYRTAVGIIGAGALHFTLAVGCAVYAWRDREDADRRQREEATG